MMSAGQMSNTMVYFYETATLPIARKMSEELGPSYQLIIQPNGPRHLSGNKGAKVSNKVDFTLSMISTGYISHTLVVLVGEC